jgi:hypothetical protein
MNAAVDAELKGIAKTNDESPFTIANELICARIGQALGLPVPAGVVAESDAKTLYYLSLDVSYEEAQLPPIIPADFVREEPWLAAGCVVFDILIANGDRNTGNLARDPNFTPPRVSLFDHGHALLGTGGLTGLARLDRATDKLGCDGSDGDLGSPSAVIDHLSSESDLEAWVARIRELPSYLFGDACHSVAVSGRLNLDVDGASATSAWLSERRDALDRLICDNQGSFPGITQWSLRETDAQQ